MKQFMLRFSDDDYEVNKGSVRIGTSTAKIGLS